MPHRITRLTTWVSDMRLPADERRGVRAERRVEARLRRERDGHDERALQLAAVEAERRRWSPGLLR